MKACNFFAVLICVVSSRTSYAQDEFENLFSLGFGVVGARFQFANAPSIQPKVHPGAYIDISFRWKNFGFTTGFQYQDRHFLETYPENPQNFITGQRHRSWINSCPLLLNYKILDARNLMLFVLPGLSYSRMADDIYPQYDPSKYYYYPKPSYTKTHIISGSLGLGAEKNIYKKDVWLNLQLHYISELNEWYDRNMTKGSNRLFVKLGLTFMMSRIDAKSKAKVFKAS